MERQVALQDLAAESQLLGKRADEEGRQGRYMLLQKMFAAKLGYLLYVFTPTEWLLRMPQKKWRETKQQPM